MASTKNPHSQHRIQQDNLQYEGENPHQNQDNQHYGSKVRSKSKKANSSSQRTYEQNIGGAENSNQHHQQYLSMTNSPQTVAGASIPSDQQNPQKASKNQNVLKQHLQTSSGNFINNFSKENQDSYSKSSSSSHYVGGTAPNQNHLQKSLHMLPTQSLTQSQSHYSTIPSQANNSQNQRHHEAKGSTANIQTQIIDQKVIPQTHLTSQRLLVSQHQALLKNIKNKRHQLEQISTHSVGDQKENKNSVPYQGGNIEQLIGMKQAHTTKNSNSISNVFQAQQQQSRPKDKQIIQTYGLNKKFGTDFVSQSPSASIKIDSSKNRKKSFKNRGEGIYESPKPLVNSNHGSNLQQTQSYDVNIAVGSSPKMQALQKQLLMNQQVLLQQKQKSQHHNSNSRQRSKDYLTTTNSNNILKQNLNTFTSKPSAKNSSVHHFSSTSTSGGASSNLLKFFANSHIGKQNLQPKVDAIKANYQTLLQSLNYTADNKLMNSQSHQPTSGRELSATVKRNNNIFVNNATDGNGAQMNENYYQLSNQKKDRKSSTIKLSKNGNGGVLGGALSKRDAPQNIPRKSSQSLSRRGKRRPSSLLKSPPVCTTGENDMITLETQQQLDDTPYYQKELVDQGIDAQKSFVDTKNEEIISRCQHYIQEVKSLSERQQQQLTGDKDKSQDDFQDLAYNLINDQVVFGNKYQHDNYMSSIKELIQSCFNYQFDQIKQQQSLNKTQQNISPSAYEMVKADYDQLSKELHLIREKLKGTQDSNFQYRKQLEDEKKKVEERDQVILMMQDTYEKELSNCFSENDIKKFGRELSVLYDQNQELHSINKRIKHELKEHQERENQLIKIIKRSPELMRALDIEDSSILEPPQKDQSYLKEKIVVSSKLVPIDKLNLKKVSEIQNLQVQGLLPPLEDSLIVDKKVVKRAVKGLILDQDNGMDNSTMKHYIQEQLQQMNESQSDNYHEFASEYGDEDDDFDYQEQLVMGGGEPNQDTSMNERSVDIYNNQYITGSNNPSMHQQNNQYQEQPLKHSESIKMIPQDTANKIKKINVKQDKGAMHSYSDR